MQILLILLCASAIFFVLVFQANRKKLLEQKVHKIEIEVKRGDYTKALQDLDDINLSSRFDYIGQKANYYSAVCLEKLERFEEALYEYVTYIAKFPKGEYVEKSKKSFKDIWRLKGTIDFSTIRKNDPCGFQLVENLITELTNLKKIE